MDKKTLRTEKLKERNALSCMVRDAYSAKIRELLMEQEAVKYASAILCYINFRSEVETKTLISLLLQENKRVFCPRVLGTGLMEFYEIRSLEALEAGYYGILEPVEEEAKRFLETKGSCMILPGACFDRQGNRIGYGAGFYDRYLETHHIDTRIGICFGIQLTEKLAADPNDQKVDLIVTENEVIKGV